MVGLAFSPNPSANPVGVEGEVKILALHRKIIATAGTVCLTALLWTGSALAAEITVQKNDTLWSLARKHGTTVQTIKQLNKLNSDLIHPGQVLQLPDKKATPLSKRETASKQQASRGGTDRIEEMLEFAQSFLGAKYRYGGETPAGFDCSGFVRYVYKRFGIELPHSSAEQYNSAGTAVKKEDLQPGDLVFFNTSGKGIGHVGIYLENNKFISASSNSRGVTVDSLEDRYWGPRYQGAKRVISGQEENTKS